MFIKRSWRCEQENATGYWRDCTETQVPLTQCTGAHYSTLSQWDRSKQALSEPKLAWLSYDLALACHPAAQSAVVGHSDSGQYGEEAWIHPNFSHFFSEQASPALLFPHPSAPSYLTQLIETLNAEIKSCTIHPFYELIGRIDDGCFFKAI